MLQFLQKIISAIKTMLLSPSLVPEDPSSSRMSFHDVLRSRQPTLQGLGQEVADLFKAPITPLRMLRASGRLQGRYLEKLQDSTECMLPSFNYIYPTGEEMGTYLALDVGGSTLRVALVELGGKSSGVDGFKILQMSVSSITNVVRRYSGTAFFDWMAEKIAEMLADCPQANGRGVKPLPVGLSWSFPVEQTSPRSGKIQGMGKGFCCAKANIGQDLGGLIVVACRNQGLNLRVDALINDSCATLLSRAYLEPSTSMSLILGTGTNMAVHLPVSCIGASKLQDRDAAWLSQARKVTINTELSMFGKGILPKTRWDDVLNRSHVLPDFQPLEYMTTGRYLGEILRLIIAEAVDTADLFDGQFPSSLDEAYSLDTSLLAVIEADVSLNLVHSGTYLQQTMGLDQVPSAADMKFLRIVVESISKRAAAYIAIAIHALWMVEREVNHNVGSFRTTIACNGSVIEKYPGFQSRCQNYIADIIEVKAEETTQVPEIMLEMADEATIVGAAVAVAVAVGQGST